MKFAVGFGVSQLCRIAERDFQLKPKTAFAILKLGTC
jgi:hypothetical protein